MSDKPALTMSRIFWFWVPLAAMWLIMAAEQPSITAIVSRLPDATANLAAFGLTFSFALIVESPVIMLLTAGAALSGHRQSYNRLYSFTAISAAVFAVFHLILCLTPLYSTLLRLLDTPPEIIELSRQAFLAMFLWTPMIAFRRMWEGTMIRYGHPQKVTMVIVVRLAATLGVLLAGLWLNRWPGAIVGGVALSVGVTAGALAAWWLARSTVAREIPETKETDALLTWERLYAFYFPLALTSFITMVGSPIVTFGLNHAPLSLESLAVWPVLMSVTFIGRSMGIAYQEVVVALMQGDESARVLKRFAWGMAGVVSVLVLLFAATPASHWWYANVSALPATLMPLTFIPTLLLAPVPGLNALISWNRSLLITRNNTKPISAAVAVNMATLLLLMLGLPYLFNLPGAVTAAIAYTASMGVEWLFLWYQSEWRVKEEQGMVAQAAVVGD